MDLSIELGSQILLFVFFNIIIIIFLGGAYVTNKEICFISVVFVLCKVLRYLFARLPTEGKTLFSSQADCCVRHLLRQNCYDDIVKFQSDLAILASSKNFDKRLA